MQPRFPYPYPGMPVHPQSQPQSSTSTQSAAPVMYSQPPHQPMLALPPHGYPYYPPTGFPPPHVPISMPGMAPPPHLLHQRMMMMMPNQMIPPPSFMPPNMALPNLMMRPPTSTAIPAPANPNPNTSRHNPVAMVPLTVYVGKVPNSMTDDLLRRLLSVFGRVLKFNRPIDSTQRIQSFAFATFEHSQSALRCLNVMPSIEIEKDINLTIKVGTKETAVLESIAKWESNINISDEKKESESSMRRRVESIILDPSQADETDEVGARSVASVVAAEVDGDEDDEVAKERAVQLEIDKFRVRQQARDREEEESRRLRVQARIRQLRERQERMARVTAEDQAAAEKRDIENRRDGLKRGGGAGGDDDADAKRRRQGVMELVSGDALEMESRAKVGLRLINPAKKMAGVSSSSSASAGMFEAVEEAQPIRSIVPIDYSAEEMLSVEASRKERQRQMVDQIPTDRNTLFAYTIDWSVVESLSLAETSLRPWIVRKIVEYLGEEEKTLIEFIIAKIGNRCNPAELLGELEAVLDEDAEQFVVKLWRMLIFSIIAAANS